jgi:serine/threonine protein kinase/predicted ATPase
MTAERRDSASPDQAANPGFAATVRQRTTDFSLDPSAGPTPEPSPTELIPNQPMAFGRYLVQRLLGTGGFGAVYLGHDSQLDRHVAIKVMRPGAGPGQATGEQAMNEARRLAQLRHAGIVTVYDVGVNEGQVFIVSDYLDGPDLGRWMRERRPGWPEAARVAAAVADALAHAHARLIVHRDVKPANILFTADGAPVLVDFGLALGEEDEGGAQKGTICGTPSYMSPEQVAGSAHRIDGRTDVYSLGVVLYEMLTGRLPFRSVKLPELLRQICDDEPQPPRQLVRDIPPELERTCLKAMAKRQQDRFTTAADFADDLRRVLSMASGQLHAPSSHGGFSSSALLASPSQSATPSSSRRSAREAERRQVTVLVCACSLFESDAYLENHDAEDQARIMRSFQHVCEESAQRFEGTLVHCNEQGLLVCFGFPIAFEDGARRAARTGLGILEDLGTLIEELRREHGLELGPSISLHTGQAVVEAGTEGVTLIGEARNVAVRLHEAAEPGQVICSEATHRLIQRQFTCSSLGKRKIKGVAQPVELFVVEGVSEARNPIEASEPADLTPLTGRDQEVSLLKDRWEQAQEGMGQVVLLIGEPGLGKSRLVYTMKQHVLGQTVEGEADAPVIEWRCSPHFQNTGLYPAIDFFERALGFGREEPPTARFERLLQRLEKYDLARPDRVPLWASLLSLPTPDGFPPLALSPVRQREETFRTMLDWLRMRAARKPVLFVVEDLHWVDASTLEFLTQFIAEGLHDSILTLLTFRPEFKTPWPAVAHQTSLALNRLTRRQARDLMQHRAGAGVADALVDQVYDRTGGVPLFVEEFTKMVQESGTPDKEDAGASRALPKREIPATLQDLVMARLDRMEGEREVAQLAATLGREFNYDLLAAAAGLDESALQSELAKLLQAEILYSKGRPPQCSFIFKHALLEDALYNSMVKATRQQFHRRIAEALEAQFPQTIGTRPEMAAHHFTEAGLPEKAIGYWLKAGLRSQEKSAENEAIGHLTQGLALLGTLKGSDVRDALELPFLGPLANAFIASRGYAAPEVGPVLRRARELCERKGQSPQLLAIIVGMWEWHFVRGDLGICAGLVAEARKCADGLDDRGGMMEALYTAGQMKLYGGDIAGARDVFTSTIAEFDDRERSRYWISLTGHDAGLACHCNLAVSLWHVGHAGQALKANQEARRIARESEHPFSVAYSLHHTCWLHSFCRLGPELQAAADEQIKISAEQGFALWHATGTFFKGTAMLLQGKRAEAIPLLQKGHDAFRSTGAELHRPFQLSVMGDAFTQAARYDEAHKVLDEGLALVQKTGDRIQEAELLRLQGELLVAESPKDTAPAEAFFKWAIETARRQGSRAWEMRSTTSLARLMQRQGKEDEAREALAAIYGTFTEGIAMPDLVDAKALLVDLK